ncbi:hypothetical protein PtA15_5A648 [Puccinia triticina]|uniref:Uncharacterized protein n=1 Tax=Puccinia triticina TaxID=208348 RepID=A0ABY7CK94_9BASI|nr:uncharacterized protein PtA15_5A648 [Puccinia triticina]WAQ85074.1 hypothetical protein PtA15_5A648 [Puccinia triticina]WAR58405.1 hypothetical protein PtB15_5B639 [Puccinia triticina]
MISTDIGRGQDAVRSSSHPGAVHQFPTHPPPPASIQRPCDASTAGSEESALGHRAPKPAPVCSSISSRPILCNSRDEARRPSTRSSAHSNTASSAHTATSTPWRPSSPKKTAAVDGIRGSGKAPWRSLIMSPPGQFGGANLYAPAGWRYRAHGSRPIRHGVYAVMARLRWPNLEFSDCSQYENGINSKFVNSGKPETVAAAEVRTIPDGVGVVGVRKFDTAKKVATQVWYLCPKPDFPGIHCDGCVTL